MGVLGMETVGTFYSDRIFNYLKTTTGVETDEEFVIYTKYKKNI